MRWEFTPAAERALARVAATLPAHAGPEIDGGLELLGVVLEDDEGAAFQWLLRMGCQPGKVQSLPVLPKTETNSSGDGLRDIPLGRELIRHLPVALTGILRSARQVADEIWGDPTITSEALTVGVFRRSFAGRQWLEEAGLSEEKLKQSLEQSFGDPIAIDEEVDLGVAEAPPGLIRLVDAVSNRLREGLRVLEDHYRFVLENGWVVGRLKTMRHEVDRLITEIPGSALALQERDIQGDVGAGLRVATERPREGVEAVLRANWKRVQEALRSLEENAKILHPETARSWEALRYEAYALETRTLAQPTSQLAQSALMMLIDADCLLGIETTIREAALGGVDAVQLREKKRSGRDLLDLAKKVRECTHKAGVLLIVNDRPDLAKLAAADAVHLGQEDFPLKQVRKFVGKEMLIGSSTHELAQMEEAESAGADYLGAGPVFPSRTKQFSAFAGLAFISQMSQRATAPWFAIGGIGPDNIVEVKKAGASRVAIGHALTQSEDPQGVARYLRSVLGAPAAGAGHGG